MAKWYVQFLDEARTGGVGGPVEARTREGAIRMARAFYHIPEDSAEFPYVDASAV